MTWSPLTRAISETLDLRERNYPEAVQKLIFDLKLMGHVPVDLESTLVESELIAVLERFYSPEMEGICGLSLQRQLSDKLVELLQTT